jgi:hypothetical protein
MDHSLGAPSVLPAESPRLESMLLEKLEDKGYCAIANCCPLGSMQGRDELAPENNIDRG